MRLKLPIFLLLSLFFLVQISAQVSITFQVDMNYQIELGNFNKNTEWVEIAGSFNGWNGSGRFQDEDGDGIYEKTISGFQTGDNIAYKFRFNGQWDGREEFPGVGNDRLHTVGSSSETLYHWYNNDTPPNADLVADFNASLREFYEQGIITFQDRSSGQVSEWEWVFEGGTPNVSNDKNPVVRYDTPGTYSVRLRVSQGDKTNTVVLEEYVTILARNTTEIPWWNETVFYEIFVRSFKDSDGDGIGDFKGIIEKLDYLNDGDPSTSSDLGITGIWLMPIHEAGSYHGYDVIDYQSVSEAYGGIEDFKLFLEEAHKRGIRVIIDFVLNHNSSRSEWFKNALQGPGSTYRDFYIWRNSDPGFSGPWGQQVWHRKEGQYYYGLFWDGMPDLNYREPKVKEAIFDAADFWLEDIGIDGFRLDAVKFIVEEDGRLEDTQATYDFWKEYTAHIKATKPDVFSVGEAWTNTETIINYVKNDRIDYCFDFDLAGNIMYSVNEGKADNLYAQLQKMNNIYPHLQYGTFLANHDQNRIMNSFGNDESKVKLAASIYLTLPGIPYLYYGEEIGMIGAKPDEDIRRPMQWDATLHAGFTNGNPWRAVHGSFPKYNVEKEEKESGSLLTTYKKMIHLRNAEKALQLGKYEAVSTDASKIFAYLRTYEGEQILVIHNTGTSVIRELDISFDFATIPSGEWKLLDLLNNDVATTVSVSDNEMNDIAISLGGRSTKVFKLTNTVSNKNIPIENKIFAFPNPVTQNLSISAPLLNWQLTEYRIFDVQGKVVGSGQVNFSNPTSQISTSNIPNGFYYVLFNWEGQQAQLTFTK